MFKKTWFLPFVRRKTKWFLGLCILVQNVDNMMNAFLIGFKKVAFIECLIVKEIVYVFIVVWCISARF